MNGAGKDYQGDATAFVLDDGVVVVAHQAGQQQCWTGEVSDSKNRFADADLPKIKIRKSVLIKADLSKHNSTVIGSHFETYFRLQPGLLY